MLQVEHWYLVGTTRLATTSNWLHITKQSWKIPPSTTEDALLSMGLKTNSPNLWPTIVEFIFTHLHTTMTIFPQNSSRIRFSLHNQLSILTMLDRYTSDCMESIHNIKEQYQRTYTTKKWKYQSNTHTWSATMSILCCPFAHNDPFFIDRQLQALFFSSQTALTSH